MPLNGLTLDKKLVFHALLVGLLVSLLSGLYSTAVQPESYWVAGYSEMIRAGFISVLQHGFPAPWLVRVVAVLGPIPPDSLKMLTQPRFLVIGFLTDVLIWSAVALLALFVSKRLRKSLTSLSITGL